MKIWTEGRTIKHFSEDVKRIPRAGYTSEGLRDMNWLEFGEKGRLKDPTPQKYKNFTKTSSPEA